MLKENGLVLFFVFALSSMGSAQQDLMGKVLKKGGREPLLGVTLLNSRMRKYNVSDMGGNYRIPAAPGDTIFFSSAGYLPDTLVAAPYMFAESFLVFLDPHIVTLSSVTVDESVNYQMDSIKRRDEYRFILDRKHPVKLWNEKRASDGPGLNFSPMGYFSTSERRKRKLKKRLLEEERDYYIDSKFPVARVAQLTLLSGDSLRLFLLRYRPSYAFCRKASYQDMLLYINDKMILFMKVGR